MGSLTAQAQDVDWQFALGVGPNFTQTDVVGNDSLKSDIGMSLWARRLKRESNWFPQFTVDYFKLGDEANLQTYMIGAGYLLGSTDRFQHDVVLGAGLGHANDFPRSTPDQKRPALQARYNIEYKWQPEFHVGVAMEFIAVDLDDKLAKEAYVSLPMVYFVWRPADKPVGPKPDPRQSDSDQDGVKDYRDRCPNTPSGSKVNNFGCVAKERIQMQVMVNFATDSDVIQQPDYKELQELADILNENPNASVTIEGHTDSTGNLTHNMDLSTRRAASVRRHMIEIHKIADKRIRSQGFGPTQPVADNTTIEGRAKNRRVLAVFEPNDETN